MKLFKHLMLLAILSAACRFSQPPAATTTADLPTNPAAPTGSPPLATGTIAAPSATPEATVPLEPIPGTVSGQVCYPSEFIPAMTAYFREVSTAAAYHLPISLNQGSYSALIPPGTYIAFAYLEAGAAGSYSHAVPCGLTVSCTDHTPLPFVIQSGQTTAGIDLCDWYGPEGFVPPIPANSQPLGAISVDHP